MYTLLNNRRIYEVDEVDVFMEQAELARDELNRKITAETQRAEAQETAINESIVKEQARAMQVENTIANTIATEANRATAREDAIDADLQNEKNRSIAQEAQINERINEESRRAIDMETILSTALDAAQRNITANQRAISEESTRARQAEQTIKADVTTEYRSEINRRIGEEQLRAVGAEQQLALDINTETNRATEQEERLSVRVGSLTGLRTLDKRDIVSAINELVDRIDRLWPLLNP